MNPGNISVTAVNNCGSSVQTTAVNPFQLTPVVLSQAGSVLVLSATLVSCQWYLNGSAIPGATSQSYIPPQDGNYHVTGIDVNGCSVQSNTLYFLLDIESTPMAGNMNLYPNPNSGVFTIEATLNSNTANVSFEIVDLMGRSVYQGELAVKDSHFRKQVQLHNAAPGMYVLKVKGEKVNESYSFAIR